MHSSSLTLTLTLLSTTALALPRPYLPITPPPLLASWVPEWHRYPWSKDNAMSSTAAGVAEPNNKEVNLLSVEGVEGEERVAARDVDVEEDVEEVVEGEEEAVEGEGEGDDEMAGVYICKDVAWGGDCTHHLVPLGSAPENCTVIPNDASSIGPDEGFNCIFYTNALCTPLASDGSDNLALSFPGSANLLATPKGDFNDRLLSFQCFRDDGVEVKPVLPELEGGVPPVVNPGDENEDVDEDGYAVPDAGSKVV